MSKAVGMPPRDRWGENIKQPTSCDSCEYLKDREKMICGNADFIAWEGPNKPAGSPNIPAKDPREYCSIWWEQDEGKSKGLIQISGLEGNNMAKKGGDFSHTVVTHHGDGTKTVHHIHRKHGHVHAVPEREGDIVGAAPDHDGMMDHIMDHTSEPNEGEDKDVDEKPYPVPSPAPGVKA